jgi:hypothetical protein
MDGSVVTCKTLINKQVISLQVDARWQIVEDSEKRLRLRRVMRTKNFTKVGSLATLVC